MVLDMLDWLAQTSDITPLAEDPRDSPAAPKPPFPWPPGAKPEKHHNLRG